MAGGALLARVLRQLAIPLVALALGFFCHLCEKGRNLGKLLVYFGSQTCMNIYVKSILNNVFIADGLKGIPASFFVTLVQQIMSGFMFVLLVVFTNVIGTPYRPKRLTTRVDLIAVVCFGMAFALNIGLNNFSLSMIPLSVNLVIRACLPLATLVSQQFLSPCFGEARKPINYLELLFMFIGVACACVTVLCGEKQGHIEENFWLGIFCAGGSLFTGAINMVLAGLLGSSLKMNPLDTTGYMCIPSSSLLLPVVFFMTHPIASSWDKAAFPARATDWEVIDKVMELNPSSLYLVAAFGPIAFAYNFFQWKIIQSLSATHTAFAGNMNKAATIVLALCMGLESLPEGRLGVLKLAAISGNILAFTAFSLLKTLPNRQATRVAAVLQSQSAFSSFKPQASENTREVQLSFVSSSHAVSEAFADGYLDAHEKQDAT